MNYVLITLIALGIALLDARPLARSKRWKDLAVVSFFLGAGYAVAILETMHIHLTSPNVIVLWAVRLMAGIFK
jgi:hypothetical protein